MFQTARFQRPWAFSEKKNTTPIVILSVKKALIANVISELKSIYRLKKLAPLYYISPEITKLLFNINYTKARYRFLNVHMPPCLSVSLVVAVALDFLIFTQVSITHNLLYYTL